jgi:hypothetical protein
MKTTKKAYGGTAESSETGTFIGGENASSMFKRGGHVSKGEMVWKKLNDNQKLEFLYQNFTPEITPRGQEILRGKAWNFLPKNVKIKFEAKYANVEDYAKGGNLKKKANYVPNYMVQSVEVERKGKTTDIDGANVLDGVYVKKGVKFANGGDLADMPESFPETDMMSYEDGGSTSTWEYSIGGL